jgi:hypothetical protein
LIENAWTNETRSPSPMMQELGARFREAGLQVFRHRRGMLFVSSIYPRAFKHDETGVSPQVRAILETIAAAPRIGRKELADKLIANLEKPVEAAVSAADEAERVKMALASDLRWLINEGYVIEFNDGSLDLPRTKVKPKEEPVEAAVPAAQTPSTKTEDVVAVLVSSTEPNKQALSTSASTTGEADVSPTESRPTEEETEIGGS